MIHASSLARRRIRLRPSVFALLAVFAVAACDNTDPLATTAPSGPIDQPPAAPVSDSAVATEGSLSPSFALYSTGLRFGTYDCSSSGLSAYNLCNRSAGSWTALDISKIKAVGAKVILNQGGYDKFRNCYPTCTATSDRRYSPTKYYNWVQSLKPYVSSWKPYLTDGTLVGIQLIDDRLASNWGGVSISNAQIDQMAKWWKQIFPGVTTFVSGGYAWNLLGYTWYYLDGSINQYNARYMGDVTTWRDKSVSAAATAKTSLILSMNVLGGGKLVSGCYRGYSSDTCSMSPTEIRSYGATIAAASGICGIGTWKYKSTYQSQYAVTDALKYVAGLASKRSAVSCKRR